MNQDTHSKVAEIAQRLGSYEVEELESRFEMVATPSSECTSTCGIN